MTGRVGAAFLFLAVLLGAFGAHGLKNRLSPEMLDIYKTGVFYHFIHALALWVLGVVSAPPAGAKISQALFAAGILVFSGSLYALSLSGVKMWGAVTPLGGLCFLAGWLFLVIGR